MHLLLGCCQRFLVTPSAGKQHQEGTTCCQAPSDDNSQPLLTSFLLQIAYEGRRFKGWSGANAKERSVQQELQKRLAKLFNNLDPALVVVEGCSRTDKGVSAHTLVAQLYALKSTTTTTTMQSSIPGKRLPHPRTAYNLGEDNCFIPVRVPLSKIGFAMNRMSPEDLRIMALAPVPTTDTQLPFHPTLNVISKTYRYTITTGSLYDALD